ncbi:MAG TPA: alpha/beta fold hydrolase [Cellulomonas sp.]
MTQTLTQAVPPLTGYHAALETLDPAQGPSFCAVFEEVCRAVPDQAAVDDGVVRLSYGELGRRSAALARAIQDRSSGDATPVAVLTGCDSGGIVADLGVLRSGRPLVVLDRVVPIARLQVIVQMSGATLLLTDEGNRDLAETVVGGTGAQVRTADELVGDWQSAAAPAPVSAEDLAVIVFTSGSTGAPKGVMYDQRFIAVDSLAMGQRFGYRAGDRKVLSFPISFAAGMLTALVALSWGMCLHVCDPREVGIAAFAQWLRTTRATVLVASPSLLRGLLRTLAPGEVLADLRRVLAGGEAVYGADVQAMRTHLTSEAVFFQGLGSSEGGSIAHLGIAADDPVPAGAVPQGTAARWRSLRVVDDEGRTLPAGEPGELIVASPVVARGYWRDPERSAARFVRREDGAVDLHTGDVGVLDEDGVLRLLGRKEAAVKVRGYLVDPSEIEATLLASGRVSEAVVVPLVEDNVTQLVGYFTPKPGERTASVAELRAWLGGRLPSWMVPAYIVTLRELPHNAAGKVDRLALPPVPPRVHVPPATPLEARVAEIWAGVLNVPQVGRTDDFYELGGDSLAVEEMLSRVEDELGASLLVSDFTQATALGDFVTRVSGGVGKLAAPRWPATTIALRSGATGRTVFCVAGGAQSSVAFSPLAARLHTDDSIVVLQMRGFERHAPAQWTFDSMVRSRLAAVRRLQPAGPYLLVGHSLGAILVLEMARRLEAQGERVFAVILDPVFGATLALGRPEGTLLDQFTDPMYVKPGRVAHAARLAKFGARLAMVPFAGLLPARVEQRHKMIFKQVGIVLRHHRPTPWAGRALAYRTADNGDPAQLWARLMPGATVRELPSDHNSLLRTPYIEVVVADLEAALADGALGAARS